METIISKTNKKSILADLKNTKTLAILLCLLLSVSACRKDRKLERNLENSTWNIDRYQSYTYVSGVRDSAQDIDHNQAGYINLKKDGTGDMSISNGPMIDTYKIVKWNVSRGTGSNKNQLTVKMDVLYQNNGTNGTWNLLVEKNEKTAQVWSRTSGNSSVNLKNTYTLSLK